MISNLKEFVAATKDGIKKNPADEENVNDTNLLMSVMKCVTDVKDVDNSTLGIKERMRHMILTLKK
jgi:hypothetical protein